VTTVNDRVEVKEITVEQGWVIFDEAAQRELSMSGKAFLEAWDAGKFDDVADRPDVMRVVMLLPLARAI
jgi:hypothetical protein